MDAAELDRLGSEDLVYTHAGGWHEGKTSFIDHIVNGELLFPAIGYEEAAKLAKEALERNVSVRQLARERELLGDVELARLLDLRRMTQDPGLAAEDGQ